jgi:hypothetical protein
MLLLALFACQIDNTVSSGPKDPGTFDPGDTAETPIDTDDTQEPQDTAQDTALPPSCEDRYYPGYSLPPIEDCDAPSAHPGWGLVEKWSNTSVGMMLSTPSIAQLTDDNGNGRIDEGDTPDVVAAPYNGAVYAFSGTDGSVLWTATLSTTNAEQTTPAIGDLDGDGFPEVVVGGLYGSFAVHGNDGSTYWTGPGSSGIKAYCGGIGIADLDDDGNPEVFIGREILDGQTGTVRGNGGAGEGSSVSGEAPNPVAADIDLDGEQELIVGNAVYDADGNTKMSFGSGDGYPGVANFDSDEEAEIVVTSTSGVTLYDTDGSQIWTQSVSSTYVGPPAIADYDGDGEPEIAVGTSNGAVMLDTDGTRLWSYTNSSGGSSFYDGVTAYDLDGDGAWEVLYDGSDAVRILSGVDGHVIATYPHETSYQCAHYVAAGDVDNDGHTELAFGLYGSSGGGGVTVLEDSEDGFAPGFTTWNQAAYSITNVDEDGSIPAYPDPNWLSYNNYRAGPSIADLFPNRNIVGKIEDVCADECADEWGSSVTFWYSVGNNGSADITDDVSVEVYGETDAGDVLLYSTTWTADLPAGRESAAEMVELTGVPKPLYDLKLKLDGGDASSVGVVGECDENDNEDNWGVLICWE